MGDGNDSITREELTQHLTSAAYTKDVINKIFTKMDTNKDNLISRQEFRDGFKLFSALKSAPGLGNYNAEFEKEIYQDADQVFQSADANNDGEIDAFVLKSHLGRKFSKFQGEAIEKIFELLDVNNDRKISRNELRDAFVRYSALRIAIGEGPNFK